MTIDTDEEDYEYEYEYDDDDDDFSGGKHTHFAATIEVSQETPDNSIVMLDTEEINVVMKRRVEDVTSVLGVLPGVAIVLLKQFQWNHERLVEAYLANPGKALSAAKLQYERQGIVPKRKKGLCEICYESPIKLCYTLPCRHGYCKSCWEGYIENEIIEGSTDIICPKDSCCGILLLEDVQVLSTPKLFNDYNTLQLRNFVTANPSTRWCPGAGCHKIAMKQSFNTTIDNVACCKNCDDLYFCITCNQIGDPSHAPVACRELQQWKNKCELESKNADWILTNTKACPKCSSRIEKNRGCNHMTCRQCKFEFCWICMGDWSTHNAETGGYYKCNKFSQEENQDGSELDRFLHYYKRFCAHAQAQEYVAKHQLPSTRIRMLQQASTSVLWTRVEFLQEAIEQLLACRRVLKYSYAFAYLYFSKQKAGKDRFEHHQEMLEKFTERLSELTEKPLQDMDRELIVNHTRVVKNFMKNVLQYVEDGMEE